MLNNSNNYLQRPNILLYVYSSTLTLSLILFLIIHPIHTRTANNRFSTRIFGWPRTLPSHPNLGCPPNTHFFNPPETFYQIFLNHTTIVIAFQFSNPLGIQLKRSRRIFHSAINSTKNANNVCQISSPPIPNTDRKKST